MVGNIIPKSVKCIHSATESSTLHHRLLAHSAERATADGQNPALPIIRNVP